MSKNELKYIKSFKCRGSKTTNITLRFSYLSLPRKSGVSLESMLNYLCQKKKQNLGFLSHKLWEDVFKPIEVPQ